MSATGARQQSPDTPAPVVAGVFRPETGRLKRDGLELREATQTKIGATDYLAAVFQRKNPRELNQSFEFRILEGNPQSGVRLLFRRSDFHFTFDPAVLPASWNWTDINRDGAIELVVQSSSGGNCWACNPTEVYRVKDGRVELIAAGPVRKIEDLNNDGTMELLVTDARWESYADLSHVSAPGSLIVYAWKNGSYRYAGPDYPDFYKGEVDRLRASLEEARLELATQAFSDDRYVGVAISIALTIAHSGDRPRALGELKKLLLANVRNAEESKRRNEVLADFQKGESAAKLAELKPGDPIPLS
jgi:hypothetical protein